MGGGFINMGPPRPKNIRDGLGSSSMSLPKKNSQNYKSTSLINRIIWRRNVVPMLIKVSILIRALILSCRVIKIFTCAELIWILTMTHATRCHVPRSTIEMPCLRIIWLIQSRSFLYLCSPHFFLLPSPTNYHLSKSSRYPHRSIQLSPGNWPKPHLSEHL